MKEKQNCGTFERQIVVGYANGNPVFKRVFVETTMTKVIVSDSKGLVGEAGVQNPKDFDFETLYRIALHKSGSKIDVA